MESSSNQSRKNKHKKSKKKNRRKKKQPISSVKEVGEMPNWLELPPEVTTIILLKLGAVEILNSAQKVCSMWRNLSKDPLMWRSIDLKNDCAPYEFVDHIKLARQAIHRSSGLCVDINIERFCDSDLLRYITETSTQLRRIRLVACYNISNEVLSEAVSKLPLLEEIDISLSSLSQDALKAIGRCCPLLRSFKLNHLALKDFDIDSDYEGEEINFDEEALTVASNFPQIHHLMLFGNPLSNAGLEAILDGCPNLVSLDLRRCFNINLLGDLGKRCAEQIKNLRLPFDSIDDYPLPIYVQGVDDDDDDYGYESYDDFRADISDLYLFDFDDFAKIPGFLF